MIDFNTETGHLRLNADEFELLVDATSGIAKAKRSKALNEAGVFDPDVGPHRALALGLSAVLASMCQGQLLVGGPRNTQLHQVWMNAGAAAMLMEVEPAIYEFVTIAPGFMPAALARICRLGPRRDQPVDDIALSKRTANGLWSEDDKARGEAAREITSSAGLSPGWRETLADETWWTWDATVIWNGGKDGRTLRVLDSAAGTYAFDDGALQPTSATQIWRAITRLFPADGEIDSAR